MSNKDYKVKDLLLQLSQSYEALATALSLSPETTYEIRFAERVRDIYKRESENYKEPIRDYRVWRIAMFAGFTCGLPLGGLFALWLLGNLFKG